MNKKRILIVCRGFYPDNSPRAHRATELAKEFAVQGHEVVVLTPIKKEHAEFSKRHNFHIRDMGILHWKTPDFGKSKIGYLVTRMAVRFLQLSVEYPDIELMFKVKEAVRKEKGYDLLISIAVPYPIHWGVAKAMGSKQSISKTWIADCGDPYVGDKTDTFRKWFYFKYVEKWFMRKTNYITIPIKNAMEGYFSEFHQKIHIIPQGFKIREISNEDNYQPNSIPSFAYAGGFIPGMRDPGTFLEFLTELKVDFRFYVYTRDRSILDPFVSKLNGKLIISDYIPRAELLIKLAKMDFLINFDNNTLVQLPSKLIDYIIVNRPVLNIKKTLDEDVIRQFLKGQYYNAMKMDDVDQYRIENVCHKFLSLSNEQK